MQKCLRFLQVRRVEALGKPLVYRGEYVMRFLAPALLLPQAGSVWLSHEKCVPASGVTTRFDDVKILEAPRRKRSD